MNSPDLVENEKKKHAGDVWVNLRLLVMIEYSYCRLWKNSQLVRNGEVKTTELENRLKVVYMYKPPMTWTSFTAATVR